MSTNTLTIQQLNAMSDVELERYVYTLEDFTALEAALYYRLRNHADICDVGNLPVSQDQESTAPSSTYTHTEHVPGVQHVSG